MTTATGAMGCSGLSLMVRGNAAVGRCRRGRAAQRSRVLRICARQPATGPAAPGVPAVRQPQQCAGRLCSPPHPTPAAGAHACSRAQPISDAPHLPTSLALPRPRDRRALRKVRPKAGKPLPLWCARQARARRGHLHEAGSWFPGCPPQQPPPPLHHPVPVPPRSPLPSGRRQATATAAGRSSRRPRRSPRSCRSPASASTSRATA
jgi:hypothetical protein